MFSSLAVMAHKIGERSYHLMCAPDAPIEDIKNALWQFSANVAKIEEQLRERAAKATADSEEKEKENAESSEM